MFLFQMCKYLVLAGACTKFQSDYLERALEIQAERSALLKKPSWNTANVQWMMEAT
jgi:hypothetical protein